MSLAGILEVLDRVAAAGRTLAVWWRDDDAVGDSPALVRLLRLARDANAPIALAAIPARAEPAFAERVADGAAVSVLVHGWRHANHAPAGVKSAEFGAHRPLAVMRREAEEGWSRLRAVVGASVLPVFVPPWNRIAPNLAASLPELGYRGLSTFGRRPGPRIGRLDVVNTHLDPVDWRGTRGPVEPAMLADALERILAVGDFDEPVGLLTHHLQADEATWSLTSRLVALLAGHPAVRFTGADEFWPGETPSSNCAPMPVNRTRMANGGPT